MIASLLCTKPRCCQCCFITAVVGAPLILAIASTGGTSVTLTTPDLSETRSCKVPITERVREAKPTPLGHNLRTKEDNCPGVMTLRCAVESASGLKACTNLFFFIQADLKQHNMRVNCTEDLTELRIVASERAKWINMFSNDISVD